MISKILVPIDGSEYANKALRFALDLAKKYEARVTLIHVIARRLHAFAEEPVIMVSENLEEEGKKILSRGQELAKSSGVVADTRLVDGVPAEEIVRAAQTENFDVIVIGSRGLTGVKAFLLGSVSDRVSHHAKCPVVIVR